MIKTITTTLAFSFIVLQMMGVPSFSDDTSECESIYGKCETAFDKAEDKSWSADKCKEAKPLCSECRQTCEAGAMKATPAGKYNMDDLRAKYCKKSVNKLQSRCPQ